MELRHLRHFVALAEERNFTRAAARELIVQSGLSSSVRALEKTLGTVLFVRGTRPVRLTVEGEALLPAARHALEAAEAARQVVHDVKGVLTGQLRIGALQNSQHLVPLASWLAEFARAHPGVDITLQQLAALPMLQMVAEGELDCALVSAVPGRTADLRVIPLAAEPLLLACRSDHPLADAESLTLDMLDGERFVETRPEWANRIQVDAAFTAAGLTRRITCEVTEWAMVLDLVSAGLGIAFVPKGVDPGAEPRSADGGLRLIPVTGVHLERRIDLVLPKGHAASPGARRFAEHIRRMRTAR
ncbi:LysR family transcriptional regulator [Streptomyces sp. NPDC001118]